MRSPSFQHPMERHAGETVVQWRGTRGAVRRAVTLHLGTWGPSGVSGRANRLVAAKELLVPIGS